jgi:hypothetical protein
VRETNSPALNRRGLDAAFEHDAGQTDRLKARSVSLLDIDNFKASATPRTRAGDQA